MFSAANIHYELADRTRGLGPGGIGAAHALARHGGLVEAIGRATGKEPRVDWQPMQAGDVVRTFADVSRARRELGYDPRIDLDEGLRRFVAWYREQEPSP